MAEKRFTIVSDDSKEVCAAFYYLLGDISFAPMAYGVGFHSDIRVLNPDETP